MVVPCVDLTLAAAVPLVTASGAHKLGLPLLAALALRDVVLVELVVAAVAMDASAGRDDHARFAVRGSLLVAV